MFAQDATQVTKAAGDQNALAHDFDPSIASMRCLRTACALLMTSLQSCTSCFRSAARSDSSLTETPFLAANHLSRKAITLKPRYSSASLGAPASTWPTFRHT